MPASDLYAFTLFQSALLLLLIFSLVKDVYNKNKEKGEVTVVRGPKSMGAIHTVYGAGIASTLVLIDRTSGLEGNAVLFIVINFLCFTYLFYFSVWFRNAVFFRLYSRVQQD